MLVVVVREVTTTTVLPTPTAVTSPVCETVATLLERDAQSPVVLTFFWDPSDRVSMAFS
jgi:hypothetical protein